MTAVEVVSRLQARGLTLVADGDVLRCRPGSALTPEDLDTLKSMKAEVLAALRREVSPPLSPVRCFACRGSQFWRSVYGVVICGRCHPPADAQLIQAWMDPHRRGFGGG